MLCSVGSCFFSVDTADLTNPRAVSLVLNVDCLSYEQILHFNFS